MTAPLRPLSPVEAEWVAEEWDRTGHLDPIPEARLIRLLRITCFLDGSLPLSAASQAEVDAVFRCLVTDSDE